MHDTAPRACNIGEGCQYARTRNHRITAPRACNVGDTGRGVSGDGGDWGAECAPLAVSTHAHRNHRIRSHTPRTPLQRGRRTVDTHTHRRTAQPHTRTPHTRHPHHARPVAQIDEMMEMTDVDGSGTVSFSEFLRMMQPKMSQKDSRPALARAPFLMPRPCAAHVSPHDLPPVAIFLPSVPAVLCCLLRSVGRCPSTHRDSRRANSPTETTTTTWPVLRLGSALRGAGVVH